MATLQSPGVQVSVIDQSNYATTGPGTVPFILLASAQDKTSTAGGVANYTTKATANVLQLVSSQKELLTNYGLPNFPSDASGNRIFGSELSEYGIMAAHSTLGLTNGAYILRADVNMNQLKGSSSRPYGNPAGGTLYQNTAITQYGIFVWDASLNQFNTVTPTVITNSNKSLVDSSYVPLKSFGNPGDFAVVALDVKNPVYNKAWNNTWYPVGSGDWVANTPTIIGTNLITATSLVANSGFTINGKAVTLGANPDINTLVSAITGASVTGVTAKAVNGKLYLFADATAVSGTTTVAGAAVADGKINIATPVGSALSIIGLAVGTYNGPAFVAQPHYNVPAWRSTDTGTPAAAISSVGTGAAAGTITSITVSNPGSGYSAAPVVQIGTKWAANTPVNVNDDIYTVDGAGNPVYHYRVVTAGVLGAIAPTGVTVNVSEINGTATVVNVGIPATATAVINNGIVTNVIVVSSGSGYSSSPVVSIAAPTGSSARPSGSVWLKTTPVNGGAKFFVYNYNASTQNFDAVDAPVYVGGNHVATYNLDPVTGGLAIPAGALFVQANFPTSTSANLLDYRIMYRKNQGATVVTGNTSNPVFTPGDAFTMSATGVGNSAYSPTVTITMDVLAAGESWPNMFARVVNAALVPFVVASVNSNNQVVITHKQGGEILLSGSPALIAAGIIAGSTANVYAQDSNPVNLKLSNWMQATVVRSPTQPITTPANGSMWYYETPLEVDIMINDGSRWRGYRSVNLVQDSRGYNLSITDSNGPIISPSKPTKQSSGAALQYGDLWIDTSDLENYPKIYRWQNVLGTNTWVSLDVSNSTSSDGVLFADARWDTSGSLDPVLDPIMPTQSMLASDYVDLDCPDPTLYPRGILLFNTRRSSFNVKKYTVGKFTNTNYPLQALPAVANTWSSISGKKSNNVPYFGRRAQRNVVVSALKEAVDSNTDVREDRYYFNLLVCPGYPELTSNLVTLNNDRRNTGFVLADTPIGLTSDATTLNNYLVNAMGVNDTNEDGLVTSDPYTGVFYPGGAITNALDGIGQVVVPITHAILRMVVKSDQNSYPWFAPAGSTRGTIDNVIGIGYLDRPSGKFYKIGTGQALRDMLYSHYVNPVSVFPSVGILNYGNHTRQAASTAMDRINVARLINYIRYNLEIITKPLVFEPNDKVTRNEAKQAVEGLMNSLVAKRGLYDYLVVCDETNNTPATIDRNELHIDIAIEPAKAVEFIYIPVRILNTGAIKGTVPGNGGISNITPSVTLQQ